MTDETKKKLKNVAIYGGVAAAVIAAGVGIYKATKGGKASRQGLRGVGRNGRKKTNSGRSKSNGRKR